MARKLNQETARAIAQAYNSIFVADMMLRDLPETDVKDYIARWNNSGADAVDILRSFGIEPVGGSPYVRHVRIALQ